MRSVELREGEPGRSAWGARFGAAVGPCSVTAVCAGRGWRGVRLRATRSWSTPPAGTPEWEEALPGLFRELRGWMGQGAELELALFRPLSHAKVLRLPPLRRAALRQLVQRGADRWFPLSPSSAVVDALPLRAQGTDGEAPALLVHACDGGRVEALLEAASAAGVRVASVTPAACAAAEAALHLAPELRRGRELLLLPCAHSTEAVLLVDGRVRLARSLPLVHGGHPARLEQLRALLRETEEGDATHTGRLRVLGALDEPLLHALSEAEAAGVECVGAPAGAEALAALGAALASGRGPDLRPEAHRRTSRRAELRRTVALAGAALVVLSASAGLHLRKSEEEIGWISRRRAILRPAVEEVLRVRSGVEAVRGRVEALERLGTEREQWTPFLASVAEALPRDAHLLSLGADGGEIAVEGYARSASAVVLALGKVPAFREVRFAAPVQRERAEGGVRERFSLRFRAPGHPLPAPGEEAR